MQKYKTIDEFLTDLSADKKAQVLEIRKYIREAAPGLTEHIKWNAISFVHNEEDRITFNLINKEGLVKLVFHMGALRKENKKGAPVLDDTFSIMQWASDIRGYITFNDLDDVRSKQIAVKRLTAKWLAIN